VRAWLRFAPAASLSPCIPTRAAKPPAGPDWVHEIKHDGYRLIVRRDGGTVRLFTRRGYDWTDRYPAIARAAAKLRAKSFTIDGEAAVCGPDGIAIFDALHHRGTVTEAMLPIQRAPRRPFGATTPTSLLRHTRIIGTPTFSLIRFARSLSRGAVVCGVVR
jgi:hypothetical protein